MAQDIFCEWLSGPPPVLGRPHPLGRGRCQIRVPSGPCTSWKRLGAQGGRKGQSWSRSPFWFPAQVVFAAISRNVCPVPSCERCWSSCLLRSVRFRRCVLYLVPPARTRVGRLGHRAGRWEGAAQSTVGKVGAGEGPGSGRGGRLPHLLLEEQSSHPVFWRA